MTLIFFAGLCVNEGPDVKRIQIVLRIVALCTRAFVSQIIAQKRGNCNETHLSHCTLKFEALKSDRTVGSITQGVITCQEFAIC